MVKKYIRYIDIATGKKFFVPIYRGREILVTSFPTTKWKHSTATAAQAHAERYAEKKRKQNQRFNDIEYRDKIMVRYAAKAQLWMSAQTPTKEEKIQQIEAEIAGRKKDE